MGDRPGDNTTEPSARPKDEREKKRGGYYYDDGTGYEIYTPSEDEEGEQKDAEQSDPEKRMR